MKILANDRISKKGIAILEKAGFEVHCIHVAPQQLQNYINQNKIEVLLVRSATKVRKELIDNCPSLRIIGRGGSGMDNIDVEYAKKKGLTVINTPGASSISVAELVFAHLFGAIRFLHDSNRNMPLEGDLHFNKLKKNYSGGRELRGKTLGIIGFGKIGKEVAKIAFGCGMRVIATSPEDDNAAVTLSFHNGQYISLEVEVMDKEQVITQSDYLSLHVPAQTQYLIDKREIALMKDGVGIVNTARGGVINESALLEGIASGKVAFAALDVYENEPTPAITILMNPKISLTPHIGGATLEAQDRIGITLANQVLASLKKA